MTSSSRHNSQDIGGSENVYVESSPSAPPFSPITPVMNYSTMVTNSRTPNSDRVQDAHLGRPLEPFSENDNPDAIALRSAISVLQIQRGQALTDLKTLEEQKTLAAAAPEKFIQALTNGGIQTQSKNLLDASSEQPRRTYQNGLQDFSKSFGNIPGPQNVVRCPAINWAKYHIIGEGLDRLHEQQKLRPEPGEPERDDESEPEPEKPPKAVIAAPYSPWTDKLPKSSIVTRSGVNRDP